MCVIGRQLQLWKFCRKDDEDSEHDSNDELREHVEAPSVKRQKFEQCQVELYK